MKHFSAVVTIASSVVLVAAVAWLGSSLATGPVESYSSAQSRDGAVHSATHVQFNAGTLHVGALAEGADALAVMQYDGPRGLRPEPIQHMLDGVAELGYASGRDAGGNLLGLPVVIQNEAASMRLQLARDVPLALNVELGAGESDLDLTTLRVSTVDLQAGAGRSRIRLPDNAGLTVATVSGGVGDVILEVPTAVAADIYVSGGIGTREVDPSRFRSIGNGHYRSTNYETAGNRIELRANLGVGRLVVN